MIHFLKCEAVGFVIGVELTVIIGLFLPSTDGGFLAAVVIGYALACLGIIGGGIYAMETDSYE